MVFTNLGHVLPGDRVEAIDLSKLSKTVLGPGLLQRGDAVYACRGGALVKREPKTYWVDAHQKRYVPAKGECVMGVVVSKAGDYFKVDIGASETASLSYLAFENATKKNRPNVKIGDVVYAKLLVANRDMEPELVCVDSHGKAGRLGVIEDGFVFTCGLHLVRRILDGRCPLIESLAKEIPFEIAAGLNGKVWINGKTTRETIAVGNAILATEFLEDVDLKKMCRSVVASIASFS